MILSSYKKIAVNIRSNMNHGNCNKIQYNKRLADLKLKVLVTGSQSLVIITGQSGQELLGDIK